MKFTDYLSRNPVGGATPEENYDEECVINILAEQANLNLKYRQLFADQSKCSKTITERKKNDSETHAECNTNQSQTNEASENEKHVNEIEQNRITTSGQSEISTLKFSKSSDKTANEKMDRENYYHWGATRKIMDIIRRNNNQPRNTKTCGTANNLTRPGPLRRRYDPTARHKRPYSHPPGQTNEAEKKMQTSMPRANRIGGGYQPIEIEEEHEEPEEPEEIREEGEIKTEEDSVIMRGDNLPIVDLTIYNRNGKEEKYIQINHIVGQLATNKKTIEDHIKQAEFEFMMDLKTLILKTAIDPELTPVRNTMRRKDREIIPECYRTAFDKLSIR